MWAQLITVTLKAGEDEGLARLEEQLQAAEQPDSGLVRSSVMREQNDPSRVHMLVVFESEEKAREREDDPRRSEGLQAARAAMAQIFAGPPQFTDLTVDVEWAP
jgi:quinol monooxygenase YgiN